MIAVGGAAQAVPMLEAFLKEHGSNPQFPVDAVARYALYRVRRSPEDLRKLVALIGGEGGGPRDAHGALVILEHWGRRGRAAAPAGPWVRELMARPGLNDEVKQRLEAFLAAAQAE